MEHRDYTVGWICAVQTEYVVACEFLDEEYPPLPSQSPHDSNAYTLGRIGEHNVVIASLPKGKYGLTSAATVAKDLLRSFESIRFGLMVGIGGGVPSPKHDIRLGDVVVSMPVAQTGGVIYYEFGKAVQERKFQRTGSLNSPPPALLTALNKISAQHERKGHNIARSVSEMVTRNPRLKRKYERPNTEDDRLYEATYVHVDVNQDCRTACSHSIPPLMMREERTKEDDDPVVHYGLIASADRLIKDATIRDALAAEEEILCFEMEAAGLMDNFPCVVIRGICDYSDTHKNDHWQGYAAATAAAYAMELLHAVPGSQVVRTKTVVEFKFYVKAPVLWPLRQRRPASQEARGRVAWQFTCGANFEVYVPSDNAETVWRKMNIVNTAIPEGPLLPTHHIDSSSAPQTPPGSSATQASIRRRDRPMASCSMGAGPATLGRMPNTAQPASGRYLHWCIDDRKVTRLIHIDLSSVTDSNLIPCLLQTYNSVRGFRSWLTLTSCCGFHKLSVESDLVITSEAIPCRTTDRDYEYIYPDSTVPEKHFIEILEAIVRARITYPRCPEVLKLGNVLQHVPNGRLQQLEGYGMQAITGYCFWKFTVVFLFAQIAPAIFAIRWLIGHKGDWHNAMMLEAVIIGVLRAWLSQDV